MTSYRLTLITPLFSKGSYDDRPEVRPSSIRGQLHWWFRALGELPADENAVFGSVHSNPVLASKVVIRVGNVQGATGQIGTLPHKHGGHASRKWAFTPGTSFELYWLERLGGLRQHHRKAFERTIEGWLLAGTLGLRATRAAGSFVWEALTPGGARMPDTLQAYTARCAEVLKNAPLRFALLQEAFDSAEEARRVVSDTLGGREDSKGSNDLERLRNPLGRVFGGRKTSPLRFRIVQVAGAFHIAALWDDRRKVTGNLQGDLKAIIDLLASRDKPIGRLLQESSLA